MLNLMTSTCTQTRCQRLPAWPAHRNHFTTRLSLAMVGVLGTRSIAVDALGRRFIPRSNRLAHLAAGGNVACCCLCICHIRGWMLADVR